MCRNAGMENLPCQRSLIIFVEGFVVYEGALCS